MGNWNGGAGAGIVFASTTVLTAANIRALVATPIALVPAQGANTLIELISAILFFNYGSNVFTETGDNLIIQHEDGTATTAALEMTGFITSTADIVQYTVNSHVNNDNLTALINQGLEVAGLSGEIAGNAGNDSTLTIKCRYMVYNTGF